MDNRDGNLQPRIRFPVDGIRTSMGQRRPNPANDSPKHYHLATPQSDSAIFGGLLTRQNRRPTIAINRFTFALTRRSCKTLLSYHSSKVALPAPPIPLLFSGCIRSEPGPPARAEGVPAHHANRLPTPSIQRDSTYVEAARLYRAKQYKAAERKVAVLLT